MEKEIKRYHKTVVAYMNPVGIYERLLSNEECQYQPYDRHKYGVLINIITLFSNIYRCHFELNFIYIPR